MSTLENKILAKENILIIIPENQKIELLSAVLGFSLVLEGLSKNIRVISSDNSHKKYNFLSHPKKISSDIDEPGELFISINTKDSAVNELRYEKLEDELRIHLKSDGIGIKKNSISAKFIKTPYDLILVFGAENISQIENFYKKNIDIFEGADLCFINKEFYSDFILDIIYKLKGILNSEIATNLFASTLIESSKPTRLGDNRLLKILSYLLKSKANHSVVTKYLFKDRNIKNSDISEIILKNILCLQSEFLLSKIPALELARTQVSSNDLISAIIETRLLIPQNHSLVVLIETPKKVEGLGTLVVLTSESKEILNKLSKALNSSSKDNYFLFSINSKNLKEAEDKVAKLIKHLFKA